MSEPITSLMDIFIAQPHEDLKDHLHLNHIESVFQSIAYVAEYREPEARHHLRRVSVYTRFVAEKVLGWSAVDSKRLGVAALMHDVGKIALPRELLLKPQMFNEEERRYMQQHTTRGFEIITELEQNFFSHDALLENRLFVFAKEIALSHHENFDGTGYPEARTGEDIPISARIAKIVDVIDALLSRRPYKASWPWTKVREEMERKANMEFDGIVLYRLLEHEDEFLDLVAGSNHEA